MTRPLATIFAISIAFAADPEWPSFRGPSSNPAAHNSNLPEKWSKSENVEWTTDIPGTRLVFADRQRQKRLPHHRHH